ncbi:AMP-binding protein [Micromonospora noduli]|uniref:Phenyloxazoline synthase n=1 Tax=Micromonospora noduli TaxID=709876 RepID=A0A328N971_9ACTN|nr:AMP-binding protein [Micromonospora noduli]KAB1928236.1 AMP-binding protein [Micromonospora noduli]RAO04200.1 Phenyloxazoline synthase [Micromonospora noduli]RAO07922.1 Phenyloxazoline synthase [Micromonospora noduli]RAO12523.1 Phenyloxazoline synthase [Micromonospora noduli]RAO32714.1 Phenyloxazoline synthase [Micromonospora noduli]
MLAPEQLNRTGSPGSPNALPLDALVRRHAIERPDAVAVVHEGRRLTYRQLDEWSAVVSSRWASEGVQAGDWVCLALPRRVELVVAVLAVLRAGAAYCIVPPDWPPAHTSLLMRQIRPARVVSTADDCLHAPSGQRSTLSSEPHGHDADSSCCMFFTSGTTSTTKAISVPHRAISRLLAECRFADLGPATAIPVVSPAHWDGFALELWAALLNGGKAVLLDEPYLVPTRLRALIAEEGVDTAWLTSSLFNLFVDEDSGSFTGMRQVLTGGERMSPTYARRFLTAHPDVTLVNGYGPAECTIFSTTHRVTIDDCDRGEIPIGVPTVGTEVYVVGEGGLREPGDVGELFIAGDRLANGYVGDPEETNRRFVTMDLPVGRRRVYRSGDLGRWETPGVLFFAGRADRQVKVRGRRIEPERVEEFLRQQPGVEACAVVPVPDSQGHYTRLAAFYTGAPDGKNLQETLRTELPDYLVPDLLRHVRALPLTTNGKLNSAALLAGTDDEPTAAAASGDGPPGDDDTVLTAVAAVYQEILGLPRVPDTASLFHLGGTSLDAARACARITERLGVPVPISEFLRHPGPRALADWIRTASDRSLGAPQGDAEGDRDVVRLTSMQAEALIEGMLREDPLAGHCMMAWWIDGEFDVSAMAQAVQDVHQRHEALRARYQFQESVVADVPKGPSAPEWAVLSGHEHTARQDLLAWLLREFTPEEGELWRAAIVCTGDRHLLGVAIDHAAFDGWSEALIAADLSTAYQARSAGSAPTWPSAPRLAEVSREHAEAMARTDLDAQRAYWKQALSGMPDLIFPSPPSPPADASPVLEIILEPAVVTRCQREARGHGTTPFVVWLCAYAEAVHQVLGSADFGVGVPVAQRGTPASQLAVSCLTGIVCFRLRPGRHAAWKDSLNACQQTVEDGMVAADVPISEIVPLLGRDRGDRASLFQTMFALQDNRSPELTLPKGTASFFRPSPDAPVTELLTEVWPAQDGGATLRLHFSVTAMSSKVVAQIGEAFVTLLRQLRCCGDFTD